jgi:hypothetical protein
MLRFVVIAQLLFPACAHEPLSGVGVGAAALPPSWTYLSGQLGGFDAPGLPPRNATLTEAAAVCEASAGCFGFSCAGALSPPPTEALPCVFRSSTVPRGGAPWQTFLRCGVRAPCPPVPPCQRGVWAPPLPGYIGAGGDVAPPAARTLAAAQAACAATAGCAGITFAASAPDGGGGVIPTVYLKDSVAETDAPGWWTYALCRE